MPTIKRGRQRYFDQLVAFLYSYIGVTSLLFRESDADHKPARGVGFQVRSQKRAVAFDTSALLANISSESWPGELHYSEMDYPEEELRHLPTLRNTGRIHSISAQGMFIHYFDSVEDLAREDHTASIVRFAKEVRNACAHGGKFTRLSDRAVEWRGYRLDSSNNGDSLLTVGIDKGDLIELMMALDDHLPRPA